MRSCTLPIVRELRLPMDQVPALKHQPLFLLNGALTYVALLGPLYMLQDMSALTMSVLQVQIPVGVVIGFFILMPQPVTRWFVLSVALSIVGAAVVFAGGLSSGNITSTTVIWLWIVLITVLSATYVVTKKLISLYSYPTATAWYYIYTSGLILLGILLTHDFSQDTQLLPNSKLQEGSTAARGRGWGGDRPRDDGGRLGLGQIGARAARVAVCARCRPRPSTPSSRARSCRAGLLPPVQGLRLLSLHVYVECLGDDQASHHRHLFHQAPPSLARSIPAHSASRPPSRAAPSSHWPHSQRSPHHTW